jgi:hypothetical protein
MRALRLRTVRAWRQRDQQRDPARLQLLAACLLLLFLAFHSFTSLLLFSRPEDLFIESAPAVRYQPHPEPTSLLAGRRNQSISSPIHEYDGKGSNLASKFSLQDLPPAVRERPMHKRFSGSLVSPWAPRAEVTCNQFNLLLEAAFFGVVSRRSTPQNAICELLIVLTVLVDGRLPKLLCLETPMLHRRSDSAAHQDVLTLRWVGTVDGARDGAGRSVWDETANVTRPREDPCTAGEHACPGPPDVLTKDYELMIHLHLGGAGLPQVLLEADILILQLEGGGGAETLWRELRARGYEGTLFVTGSSPSPRASAVGSFGVPGRPYRFWLGFERRLKVTPDRRGR